MHGHRMGDRKQVPASQVKASSLDWSYVKRKHGDLLMRLGRDYEKDNPQGRDESLSRSQVIDASAFNKATGIAAQTDLSP